MKQDIKPTRATLLGLSKKVRMVSRGHGLLKRKLDSLILELSSTAQKARELESEFSKKLEEARRLQILALMEEGPPRLIAGAIGEMGTREVGEKVSKFMGLTIKALTLLEGDSGETPERKHFLSIGTLQAKRAFDGLLEDLVALASAYNKVHLLLSEVERTRRRVNALEFKVIPETEEAVQFIEGYLGEQERESLFRVKRAVQKK